MPGPPGIDSSVARSGSLVLGGAVLSPRGGAGTCSLESDVRASPGVGENPGPGWRSLLPAEEGSQCPGDWGRCPLRGGGFGG